jgi:hypothetical protein
MSNAAYAAWSEPIETVAKHHGTSLQRGLNAKQVAAAREAYGFNELPPEESKSMLKLVLEQFDDNLVKVSYDRPMPHKPPSSSQTSTSDILLRRVWALHGRRASPSHVNVRRARLSRIPRVSARVGWAARRPIVIVDAS